MTRPDDWDARAATFDDEAGHGLRDDAVVWVLVEGRWASGGGLTGAEVRRLVEEHRAEVDVVPLDDPVLWGRAIRDERFLVVSRR